MKSWLISLGAAIAALAVVAANIDKVVTIGVKWLGPVLAPYINPQAQIAIRLDDEAAAVADVFVSDPASETHPLASARTRYGQEAVLTVPANILYKIGWQGPKIEAGAVERVLAVKGESSFHLVSTGEAEGRIKVTLRETDGAAAPFPATEPSAKLLIAARAANEAAAVIGPGALPELDRAVAIVGLFETGTTDCARRVFSVPAFVGGLAPGAKTIAVGCLAFESPGWLADVITATDGGEAHRLDAILADDAPAMRSYAREMPVLPPAEQLQRAGARLVASPEFWIAYQSRVLQAYAQATDIARHVGLVSERGRLLVFDQLIVRGPGGIARAAQAYTQRYGQPGQAPPDSEKARILALGNIFKALPAPTAFAPAIARRIDTIVTGRGSARGIAFDLDQLGVSDAG